MLEVQGLTKSFGGKCVVSDVSFQVTPGRVTGFVGPNGAGKSTTMRMMTGLVHPDAGSVLYDGRAYGDLPDPTRVVGTVLGQPAANPRERVGTHLCGLAIAAGVSNDRVQLVMDQVGLGPAAKKRVGKLSLGMGQRLALAEALLGEPSYVILDEPFIGLDVDGIRWLRSLILNWARAGLGVLLSNHHMAEMELLADDLVMIGSGKIVQQGPASSLLVDADPGRLLVATDRPAELISTLRSQLFMATEINGRVSVVTDARCGELRSLLDSFGVARSDVEDVAPTLEDIFVNHMADHTEFSTQGVFL